MPRPQEVPILSATEEAEALPLEVEIPRVQSEYVERIKETQRLEPGPEDQEAIQEAVVTAQEAGEADRLVTGERAVPLPAAVETAISWAPHGPEQVLRAMMPKKILTEQETRAAEQNFRNKIIPGLYQTYLNELEENPNTPSETYDQATTSEGYKIFEDEVIKSAGKRGQWLIRDDQGRVMTGLNILGTEILGSEQTMMGDPNDLGLRKWSPAVVEETYGALLRDFLIFESGVTAIGQEVLEGIGGGDVVGTKTFWDRWAKNQQMGYGIEELASDLGELPATRLQQAAQAFVETSGQTGLTGPDDTFIKDLAEDPEFAKNVGDGLWWVGLAASFALPFDMYLGWAAKTSSKVAGKAAKAAKAASATHEAPFLGRFLGRQDLADDLGMNPHDLRLDLVESAALNETAKGAVKRAMDNRDLSPDDVKIFEEAGLRHEVDTSHSPPLTRVNSSDLQEIVRDAAKRGQRYLTREQDILEEARPRVDTRVKGGSLTETVISWLQEAEKAVVQADGTVSIRTPEHIGHVGPPRGEVGPIFHRFLEEQVSIELAKRQAQKAMETGRARVGKEGWFLPRELTLLTPRLAVPAGIVKDILRRAKDFKLEGGKPMGEALAELARLAREKADIGPGDAPRPGLKAEVDDLLAELSDSFYGIMERSDVDQIAMEMTLNALGKEFAEATDAGNVSRIARDIADLVVEAVAFELAPNRILGIADLEKIHAGSAKTLTAPPKPIGVGDAAGSGAARPSRTQQITAARNIVDINDLMTPKELKKSYPVKLFEAAMVYAFPTGIPVSPWIAKGGKVGGVGKGPAYKLAFKRLRDRLGNMDEEAALNLSRRAQDIERDPKKYADKHGIPVEDVPKYKNILAFGEVNSEVFGTPLQHFNELVKTAFGSTDDIGILWSTRYGNKLLGSTNQQDISKAIDEALKDPNSPLSKLQKIVNDEFMTFSPEYFEFLDGVGVLLGGRSLADITPKPGRGAHEMVWRWKPESSGENVGRLYFAGLRTKAIREFSEEITRRYPEFFEGKDFYKGLTHATDDPRYLWADIDRTVENVLEASRREGGYVYPRLSYWVSRYEDAVGQGAFPELIQKTVGNVFFRMEGKTPDIATLVRAAFRDRVEAANGGSPHHVKAYVEELVIDQGFGEKTFQELKDAEPRAFGDGAHPAVRITEGEWETFLVELLTKEWAENPITNKIFEVTYLDSVTKNVPADKIQGYLDVLGVRVEAAIKRLEAGEEAEPHLGNISSELTAYDDLPLYAFDTPSQLRSDVNQVLQNTHLNNQYVRLNEDVTMTQPEAARLLFDGLGVTDAQTLMRAIEGAEKVLKASGDDAGSVAARRFITDTLGIPAVDAASLPSRLRNLSKSGVLAGNIVPNPKYHLVNILSAPAIILSTLGAMQGAKAMWPRWGSTKVLRELYSRDLPGLPRLDDPNQVLIPISKKNPLKTYTVGDVADIVARSGINQSQASAEVRTQIFRELVKWTGENMRDTKGNVPAPVNAFLRALRGQLGGGRTVWGDFANACDSYFRVGVLNDALKRGVSEEQAIDLARQSMFDYANLTPIEKEYVMKGIWIYTFQSQAWRTAFSNLVNNPTRLLQQYKLARGYPYGDEDENMPFISRYKNSKVFLGIRNDPDTMERFALYGPDVPVIGAFADLVWATEGFLTIPQGTAPRTALMTAGEKLGPWVELGLGMAGVEFSWGDMVVDSDYSSAYIDPAYINFLVATNNWDTFKAYFDVVARAPRRGRGSYMGYEWQINPDNGKARSSFNRWQQTFKASGYERTTKEASNILVPQFQIEGLEQPKVRGFPFDVGALHTEQLPSQKEQEKRILRNIKDELGVRR